MSSALYGGSFDPPHFGHVYAVLNTLMFTDVNQVIMCPASDHPTKNNVASFYHRYRMVQNLTTLFDTNKVRVSDAEQRIGGPGYTIELVEDQGVDNLILGADTANDLFSGEWYKSEELINMLHTVYVVALEGVDLRFSSNRYPCNIEIVAPIPLDQVKRGVPKQSSTSIRAQLYRGVPVDDMLPNKTVEYIEDNNLYQNGGRNVL